jgi:signal transduction histidine kinase/ActR/RegA family two-component response regulator
MHERLRLQIAEHLGDPERVSPDLSPLFEAISATYAESDAAEATSRELRKRALELDAILDNLPESYGRLTAEGVYIDFRRPKRREFVLPVESIRGKHFRDTVSAETAAKFEAAMAAAKDSGQTALFEFELPGPNGTRYREARLSRFGDDEFIVIIVSKTKQKEYQTRLNVAERMASVGTLAAGVAHEINNPLAYMLTNLEWSAEVLADLLSRPASSSELPELLKATQETRLGVHRVSAIVRDLMTFSRGGEGALAPQDIHAVIECAVRMATNEIRHRARLVRRFGELPPVLGDEGRLVQLFLNLLLNAAHAIDEGHAEANEITITTSLNEASQVVIEVRDTGRGIPKDVIGRVFDPFFTTKDVGKGTGLGLSICHGIVTSLGGAMQVESEVGAGSAFRVLLAPAAFAGPTPAPPPVEARAKSPRSRVLVVDDDAIVGTSLQRSLAVLHDVVVVQKATDALARVVAGEHFDVILCDLMMPEMSGMDLHAAISEKAPAMLDRMIFMTGGAFTDGARAFFDRVTNVKLDKPVSSSSLQEAVRSLRGRQRASAR